MTSIETDPSLRPHEVVEVYIRQTNDLSALVQDALRRNSPPPDQATRRSLRVVAAALDEQHEELQRLAVTLRGDHQ